MITLSVWCFIALFSISVSVLSASQEGNGMTYRLPTDLIPHHYDIFLIFHERPFNQIQAFKGSVDIFLKVHNRTKQMILHSLVSNITGIRIKSGNSTLQYENYINNDVTEQLVINMEEELNVGVDYQLSLSYIGNFSDEGAGVQEIIRRDYGNEDFYLIWTQFEATHARTAFPCFDEPQLKATFNLTLTYPSKYVARANTERENVTFRDDFTIEKFRETPMISTYLVAFIITNYTSTGDDTIRIWGEAGTEDVRNITLAQVTKLLDAYSEIMFQDFQTIGVGKIDFVPIPEMMSGGMENWGLITVRSNYVYENGRTIIRQQDSAYLISHELAHIWLGNLVTIKWWSDNWLKEGFAEYFSYFATDLAYPNWKLNEKFLIDMQKISLHKDTTKRAHPLSHNANDINSNDKVNYKFDNFNYLKGACIVRMASHIVGDNFNKGVQKYLKDNAFKTASPKDLWDALESQSSTSLPNGKTMADVMDNWVYKHGYPLITVSYSNNQVRINQTRFCEESCLDNTKWYVPIFYKKHTPKTKTESILWLTPEEDLTFTEVLNDDEFILVNNEARGFYKVNYDMALWNRIDRVLKKNHTEITTLSRIQIINDLFTWSKYNVLPYSTIFNIKDYLIDELNINVWKIAVESFRYIASLSRRNRQSRDVFRVKLLKLFDRFYKSYPLEKSDFNNSHYTLNQVFAHETACLFFNEDCIKKALHLFALFKQNTSKYMPNPNLQKFVFCNAIRNSSNSDQDWQFLFEQINTTKYSTQKMLFISGLACSLKPHLKIRYMETFLPGFNLKEKRSLDNINHRIPLGGKLKDNKEAYLAFKALYSQPEGFDVSYEYFKKNFFELIQTFRGTNYFIQITEDLLSKFTQQDQIDDLKLIIENEELPPELEMFIITSINSAQINVDSTSRIDLNKLLT